MTLTIFVIIFTDVKRACELLEKLQKSKYCGEVPATKLAALQKVLQSEFLNAVREVYEHVYETVDVQGNPEIRASATAKVKSTFIIQPNSRCQLKQNILHLSLTSNPNHETQSSTQLNI